MPSRCRLGVRVRPRTPNPHTTGNFEYHLIPFEAAFEAGTSQIMPYYGMPVGTEHEEVAFGFNRGIITGLLRAKYGFDGIVCTDWGILNDTQLGFAVWPARAWGVEHMSIPDRAKKALDAGIDQFGGESCPEVIVELVRSGQVEESRIDASVWRLLREKFKLGLFDNPYVDAVAAERIAGNEEFCRRGELAQRKSIVLLKNGTVAEQPVLPLRGRPKVYVENIPADLAGAYAAVVENIEDADVAILRLQTPYQPRQGNFLERLFHAGDLDFKEPEKGRILSVLRRVPTILDIYLDRPAIIPEIAHESAALLANFGANAGAVLDVIFGRCSPTGRLPWELPSSTEAVRKQKEDLPYDSEDPLYPFGHGLNY